MTESRVTSDLSRWELAAEHIAVKMRWFGLLFGYLLANLHPAPGFDQLVLNAILALGLLYAVVDTACSLRGWVFLRDWPLLISLMEALFIGLLCYWHSGLDSPFRYYYILSLVCCAIRYPPRVTYITWGLHGTSYTLLYLALPEPNQDPLDLLLLLVVLGWVTWAGTSLALLLKRVGDHLAELNQALEGNRLQLEERIAERTRELQETQAHLLHQEKMAAFGLLAAGIAHEVGNPLTSVSSLVQLLQKRNNDHYTQEKLALVSGQLQRIQGTLRELINFSRPGRREWLPVSVGEVVHEALSIAKYYKRIKGRQIETHIEPNLPPLLARRDLLVQVILNLVLNAIDATEQGGRIVISARRDGQELEITVQDDGSGIAPVDQAKLFQPYFTTKKHGTGLGLFVTRTLVGEHAGRIEFDSALGIGTTFRVRLPLPITAPWSRLTPAEMTPTGLDPVKVGES